MSLQYEDGTLLSAIPASSQDQFLVCRGRWGQLGVGGRLVAEERGCLARRSPQTQGIQIGVGEGPALWRIPQTFLTYFLNTVHANNNNNGVNNYKSHYNYHY